MTEKQFWLALEFRVCGEFSGLPERWQRRYWCDGFIPGVYVLDADPPKILGKVWMCEGTKGQTEWDFAPLLPKQCISREIIDWELLLQKSDCTKWLSFDEQKK